LLPDLLGAAVSPGRAVFQPGQQLIPMAPNGGPQLVRQSGLGMNRQAVTDHPKGGSPLFDGLQKLVHRHVGLPPFVRVQKYSVSSSRAGSGFETARSVEKAAEFASLPSPSSQSASGAGF